MSLRHALVFILLSITPSITRAADAPAPAAPAAALPFTRQQDVVYGRKFGTALTLDVVSVHEVEPTAASFNATVLDAAEVR